MFLSCSVASDSFTDGSMPGSPVLHHLLELAQAHVHWASDVIPFSVIHFSSCPQSFPASGSFPVSWLFASGGQSIGASASASVLPMNIQDWFPLGWTGLILLSKGLSKFFSNNNIQKHVFLPLSLLYGPAVMSVHDYWRNHSFDYMNLCSSITIYFSLFLFIAESQILFFILLIYKL